MPYRIARVPGDSRCIVLHPERSAGTKLLLGLGGACTSVGVALALAHPAAGIVLALASAGFSGWIGTEAFLTRVEVVRDEREGRVVVRASGVGGRREAFVAIDDVRDVIVETGRSGTERLVFRLNSGERIPLTPYSVSGGSAELARELTAHVQGS